MVPIVLKGGGTHSVLRAPGPGTHASTTVTTPSHPLSSGAAYFNLHMLTSDLWSAAARAILFGGFGSTCSAAAFAAALALVAAGLGVYFSAGAPKVADGTTGLTPQGRGDGFQLLGEDTEMLDAEDADEAEPEVGGAGRLEKGAAAAGEIHACSSREAALLLLAVQLQPMDSARREAEERNKKQ